MKRIYTENKKARRASSFQQTRNSSLPSRGRQLLRASHQPKEPKCKGYQVELQTIRLSPTRVKTITHFAQRYN